MRTIWCIAVLAAATAATPATAQDTNDVGGIPTETQERMRSGGFDVPWGDLIGLLGLFGLLGLKKEHGEDSYHPASVE